MQSLAQKLTKLYATNRNIFTTHELMLYWGYENKNSLYVEISRLVKRNYLKPIKKGLYMLATASPDLFEIAGKIYPNSYISFETVLAKYSIINQWYGSIFLAGPRTLTIKNKFGTFKYRTLPDFILSNRLGIQNINNKYFIATKERAVCDYFYKVGFQQLDDPYELDTEMLQDLATIYESPKLQQDISKLINIIKNTHEA